MAKDKAMIWDDCAQCAYKHLAAAYAEMTAVGATVGLWHDSEAVLVARAVIALTEVRAGYPGNADLAAGCLAAAETRADSHAGKVYRQARMKIQAGAFDEAMDCLGPVVDGWTEAHVTEALREFAELGDGSDDVSAMTHEELAQWLRERLKYLRETFEIGKEVTV